jgi:hypothetical protein
MIQTIDTLLLKNIYFKKLSIADRLAIYNIALKQVAELRNYFYTNQTSITNFTINISNILSSMNSIDDILLDDLQSLTQQERLLIYNIVQSRIASLRNLQNHHYYLITNTRGALSHKKTLLLPITNWINEIILIIKEKILTFPISNSIIAFSRSAKVKTLTLPILVSIVAGLQQSKILQFPIIKTIVLLGIFQTKIKSLVLPIQGVINLLATGTTKIKSLVLPITNSMVTIFASYTIQQKVLSLPILKSIITLASYQYLKEKRLTMPINHSINTI